MVNVPHLSYFFILGFIITIPLFHPILIPPDLGLQTWLSSDLSCHLPSGKHTKTMENHHFSWENPLFLWPFSMSLCNKLPEGTTIDDLNYRCLSSLFWASKKTSLHIANDDLLDIACIFSLLEHEHGNTIHSFTTWLKMAEKPTVSFVMMHLQGALFGIQHLQSRDRDWDQIFIGEWSTLMFVRQDGNQHESNFVSLRVSAFCASTKDPHDWPQLYASIVLFWIVQNIIIT